MCRLCKYNIYQLIKEEAQLKKIVIVATVLCLVSGLLAGCSGREQSSAQPGASGQASAGATPAQQNVSGGELKLLSENTGGKDADEMIIFCEALSEATGYKVSIEMPPADYQNVVMQKLQSGETYDLIYCTQLFYLNLISQGALVDLTEKVAQSDILSKNVVQSEWDDIAVDGKIFAGFNKKEIHKPVLVNKVHLQQAGIDYKAIEPTLDGYYNVFKTLKDSITTPDYYPLNIVLKTVNNIQPWMAAVGLKGGIVVDTDGKTYVPFATDEAAPVWDWLRKLYAEELLDPACFVDGTGEMRSRFNSASRTTSVVTDWAAYVGLHNNEAAAAGIPLTEYEVVSTAGPKTPDGSYMLTKGAASLWVIPVNAQDPEGAFKVLEYFATQEGGELLSIGIRDYDYTEDNGTYKQTEIGALHRNDHGAPIPIYKDFVHPLGLATGMEEALATGVYATIDTPTEVNKEYEEIVGNWGGQIVKGEIDTLSGLKSMRDELLARGVTQK